MSDLEKNTTESLVCNGCQNRVQSRLSKGYSYLFASVLTALLAFQSIQITAKTDKSGNFEFAIATKEINLQFFYPCAALIGVIIGLPIDAIALAFGKYLSGDKE